MVEKRIGSDIEIAQQASMKPIGDIAAQLSLATHEWMPYGHYKAKLSIDILDRLKDTPDGQLILVTSINPTPAGEGKSTVTVGLGQALNRLGKRTLIALREPSLGPNMGLKGGAAGGGYSQVVPMDELNLHFTGDIHAITAANNLLSALIDNHLQQGNALGIDPRRVVWKRALDLNDRALRQITVGLGGPANGIPREDGFQITVASEIMAVLCLASSLDDLRERLGRMVVAWTADQRPIQVSDLGAEGALTLLLKDALNPNLIQTLENTPALVHGGPFANIAHGCNSLLATRMALKLGDYVVTEAGFGADLGAEKFLDIKARMGGLSPKAVVIVATARALKMHGGVARDQLGYEDVEALARGMENLKKHIETIQSFGLPFVVAINRFSSDTANELDFIQQWCDARDYPVAESRVWAEGGAGGEQLAKEVLTLIEQHRGHYQPLYDTAASIEDKLETLVTKVYGGRGVELSSKAAKQLADFKRLGWDRLCVCVAKTQYSLSDDPTLLGRPSDFVLHVREFQVSLGAGFIVALTGNVMTMPGLPKRPAALDMDVLPDGRATGLF